MNSEQNVQPTSESGNSTKPVLPAVAVPLYNQALKNPNTFSIVWAKVWQLTKDTVYILSVQESKSSRVTSVDLYYNSPKAAKDAFKRYWGKHIDEAAQWSDVRQ